MTEYLSARLCHAMGFVECCNRRVIGNHDAKVVVAFVDMLQRMYAAIVCQVPASCSADNRTSSCNVSTICTSIVIAGLVLLIWAYLVYQVDLARAVGGGEPSLDVATASS